MENSGDESILSTKKSHGTIAVFLQVTPIL